MVASSTPLWEHWASANFKLQTFGKIRFFILQIKCSHRKLLLEHLIQAVLVTGATLCLKQSKGDSDPAGSLVSRNTAGTDCHTWSTVILQAQSVTPVSSLWMNLMKGTKSWREQSQQKSQQEHLSIRQCQVTQLKTTARKMLIKLSAGSREQSCTHCYFQSLPQDSIIDIC